MNDEGPRGPVERRLQQALDHSSGVMQKRTDGVIGRAARTVRRGSIVLAIGWLGLVLFVVAWVMFNLAMHGWAAGRWSVTTAHFVIMGINLLGAGILILVAALLAPTVEGKAQANGEDDGQSRLSAKAQLDAGPPADSIEGAIGSAIELGLLAAQTIPQLIRAFHKPKAKSELPPRE